MSNLTNLATQLGERLKELGAQITTVESLTGGGIAQTITAIAGSSEWFEAGYVTYSNKQKHLQVGVPEEILTEHGPVSEPVVKEMVKGALERSGARFAVAVSGVAGPGGGTEEKPVGTVWIAWADGEKIDAKCIRFAGNRDQVREQTIVTALIGVIQMCNAYRGFGAEA